VAFPRKVHFMGFDKEQIKKELAEQLENNRAAAASFPRGGPERNLQIQIADEWERILRELTAPDPEVGLLERLQEHLANMPQFNADVGKLQDAIAAMAQELAERDKTIRELEADAKRLLEEGQLALANKKIAELTYYVDERIDIARQRVASIRQAQMELL
jgi:uncharacterized protein (DUF3084 family)